MTHKLHHLSASDDGFQELLSFGEIILDICRELQVTPIVYGSLAYFYHTEDTKIPINDLDLLVPENAFPELMRMLEQSSISFDQKPWQSIVASRNSRDIDLDSIERYLDPRSREAETIQIGNLKFDILNTASLTDIYQEAVDRMPQTHEFEKRRALYAIKLHNLKSVK